MGAAVMEPDEAQAAKLPRLGGVAAKTLSKTAPDMSVEQAMNLLKQHAPEGYLAHDNPVRKQNFENWFGYSHVVDENGKPVVLYHGTDKDFNAFDPKRIGETDHGWYGEGHYLTASPELASGYSGYKNMKAMSGEEIHPGQNVMPVYARLENPYVWPADRPAATNREEAKKITNELIARGHDGVIAPNQYADGQEGKFWEVVAFDPKQIKSAIGNRGTYNLKSPKLNEARGGSIPFGPDAAQRAVKLAKQRAGRR